MAVIIMKGFLITIIPITRDNFALQSAFYAYITRVSRPELGAGTTITTNKANYPSILIQLWLTPCNFDAPTIYPLERLVDT